MQDFRDLLVWQKAHVLALETYKATQAFPKTETYGLTSQMRRAAVSVPSNISEGCGRGGWPELIQFCQIAFGSLTELEYQVMLATELGYLSEADGSRLMDGLHEVKRMLASFLATIRARNGRERTPTLSRRRTAADTNTPDALKR